MPLGKTNFYLFSLQNYNHFPFLQNILKLFSSKTEEIVIFLQIYPHFLVFKSAETGDFVPSDTVMQKKFSKWVVQLLMMLRFSCMTEEIQFIVHS